MPIKSTTSVVLDLSSEKLAGCKDLRKDRQWWAMVLLAAMCAFTESRAATLTGSIVLKAACWKEPEGR